jgi:hypothetical protein
MPIVLRLAVTITLLSIAALLAQPLPIGAVELTTTGRIVTALVAVTGAAVSLWLYMRDK